MHLNTHPKMLIDQALISQHDGVCFSVCRPERREVTLPMDKPWEGMSSTYQSVLDDGKQVLLYYRGWPPTGITNRDDNPEQCTCVAVSDDGIHFRRPELDLISYNGHDKNNVILHDHNYSHNFAPFYDDNPNAGEFPYKALAGEAGGLVAFGSRDGIHWEKMQEEAVLTDGAFDSLNTVFYDAEAGLYRCYSRYWNAGLFSGFRSIQSCVSTDFIHWSKMTPNRYVGYDEGLPMHLYTNSTRPLPGAPEYFVAFPMRFQQERMKVPTHMKVGVSDCLFMFSHDGVTWTIPGTRPWIYPGTDIRNWTERNLITSAGLVWRNGEHSIYVMEHYEWDDCRMVRYSVPEFRFGSAYSANGTMTTQSFVADEDRITVNYRTSAYGTLKVAVLQEDGTPLEGFSFDDCEEIYGDETDYRPKWKSEKSLKGKKIRLAFRLQDAEVFAFAMAPKA